MAQSLPADNALDASASVLPQRCFIMNNHGEKLAALLHKTESKKLVVVCHGFRSSKDYKLLLNLSAAITSIGLSVVRFDFSGNGESEGVFEHGHLSKEVEDLHAVVLYFSKQEFEISAIIGHSKGGLVVLLYASTYHDVPTVINLSSRFHLKRGIERVLGDDYLSTIKKGGFIDVMDKSGKVAYRVTEKNLMEGLNIDMHAACLSIDKGCRVFTVHGSDDEITPVEDASAIAELIANHKLHIIEGANHCYTEHQEELAKVVVDFLASI